MDIIMNLAAAVLAAAAISFTVTITGMFKWFRELVSPIHHKVEELVHCPWCFGHWTVFVMLLTSNIELLNVSQYAVFNFLFTAFAIIGGLAPLHYLLLRAYEPVAKMAVAREIEKLKKMANKNKIEVKEPTSN